MIADAHEAGADRFLLGGDLALFGPHPAATVDRLRSLDADWIRGNGERWTARPGEAPDDDVVQGAIAACRSELGDSVVRELEALPETLARDATVYCHGSPASDVRSFWPVAADDEAELLAEVSVPRLVFGHTHLPFVRRAEGGIELVNPGSVGMPFDGDPRAAYALASEDGRVDHRRVAYDHIASAATVRERFQGGFADTVARRIERARADA